MFKGRLHGVYTSWVPTVWGHQKQTDCPVTPQLSLKVLYWHLPEKRASCGDGRPPSKKSDPFRMMSWNEKNMPRQSRQSDSRYHGPFGCWWGVNLETHPIYISLPTKNILQSEPSSLTAVQQSTFPISSWFSFQKSELSTKNHFQNAEKFEKHGEILPTLHLGHSPTAFLPWFLLSGGAEWSCAAEWIPQDTPILLAMVLVYPRMSIAYIIYPAKVWPKCRSYVSWSKWERFARWFSIACKDNRLRKTTVVGAFLRFHRFFFWIWSNTKNGVKFG